MRSIENSNGSSGKIPLVIIAGPTATGKSHIAVQLAKITGGEVISADSMQVYKGMDIGSAKITEAETEGIRHHLIDILEPDQPFSVCLFRQMAKEAVLNIHAGGKLPIVAGGTGFYIQALLYDIDFPDEPGENGSVRRSLEEIAAGQDGRQILYEQLKEVDPGSAEAIHPHNIKRVIRALEYYRLNGHPISEHNQRERQKESPYRASYFVLTDDREKMYAKIDRRVDMMVEAGLEAEVRQLLRNGVREDMPSMQGLGYKEMIRYILGRCSLDEAVYTIKRDTRHFAKRQLTWFRRERDVTWVDKRILCTDEAILAFMLEELRRKQVI